MTTRPTPAPSDLPPAATGLGRILAGLQAGDAAFLFTFVERFGPATRRQLARLGADTAAADRLVHDVALALLDGAGDESMPAATAPGWDRVVAACAEVLGADDRRGTIDLGSSDLVAGDGGAGRALHLIDVENLAGGPARWSDWFRLSLRQFVATARVATGDLVVMAADIMVYKATAFAVRGCRYAPGFGPDGADRVLLDAAPPDLVRRRFDRLVVASGDHAFAPLVAEAQRAGVAVEVVSRPTQLAGVLRRAAPTVRYLPDLPDTAGSQSRPAAVRSAPQPVAA